MVEELEKEISILDIINYIKKEIWSIILCAFFTGLIAILGTLFLEDDVYQATSTIIMAKEAAKIFYDDAYTKSDIDLYQQVGNTYIEIANSNVVIDGAIQILKDNGIIDKEYTREQFKNIVSAEYDTGTLIITLRATSVKGDNVCAIANAYRESFIEVGNTVLPVSTLQVLDVAEVPVRPQPSNIKMNTIIGIMIGVGIAGGYIFLKYIVDSSKVQTVKEVEELLDINVIAQFK